MEGVAPAKRARRANTQQLEAAAEGALEHAATLPPPAALAHLEQTLGALAGHPALAVPALRLHTAAAESALRMGTDGSSHLEAALRLAAHAPALAPPLYAALAQSLALRPGGCGAALRALDDVPHSAERARLRAALLLAVHRPSEAALALRLSPREDAEAQALLAAALLAADAPLEQVEAALENNATALGARVREALVVARGHASARGLGYVAERARLQAVLARGDAPLADRLQALGDVLVSHGLSGYVTDALQCAAVCAQRHGRWGVARALAERAGCPALIAAVLLGAGDAQAAADAVAPAASDDALAASVRLALAVRGAASAAMSRDALEATAAHALALHPYAGAQRLEVLRLRALALAGSPQWAEADALWRCEMEAGPPLQPPASDADAVEAVGRALLDAVDARFVRHAELGWRLR